MTTAVGLSPTKAGAGWAGRVARSALGFLLHRRWITLIVIAGVWHLIAIRSNTGLLPTPLAVAEMMWEVVRNGEFVRQMGDSMQRIAIGYAGAMLLGSIIGVVSGAWRFWEQFFQDLVVIMLSLPGLIYALLSVMIFGLGPTAPIMAILLGSYPFVAVNVRQGLKALDKELVDMARAYKVGGWKTLRHVILWSLLPHFFAAFRIGFTIAWKVSVLSEVYGASSGVGYMIRVNFQLFRLRGIMAWGLLFGLVMMVIEYGILMPIERYLQRWRPKIKEVI